MLGNRLVLDNHPVEGSHLEEGSRHNLAAGSLARSQVVGSPVVVADT